MLHATRQQWQKGNLFSLHAACLPCRLVPPSPSPLHWRPANSSTRFRLLICRQPEAVVTLSSTQAASPWQHPTHLSSLCPAFHCCCIKITYFVGAACDVECCFVWSATCPLIVACKRISALALSLSLSLSPSLSVSPCSLPALQIYDSAFFSLLLTLPLSLYLLLLHPLHSLLLKFAHFVLHMLLAYDFVLYPNKSVESMTIDDTYNRQATVIHCSLI